MEAPRQLAGWNPEGTYGQHGERVVVDDERAQGVEVADGVRQLLELIVMEAEQPQRVLESAKGLGQGGEVVVVSVELLQRLQEVRGGVGERRVEEVRGGGRRMEGGGR